MKCLFVVFLQLILFSVFCGQAFCEINYYWRDYTGKIPGDAVPGGTDVNKETTYIGQAYIKDGGIIPVMIYPGKKYVVANISKMHKTETYIKILCSSSLDKFKWVPATGADLHVKMVNKHLVRGGVEYGLVTNIGRVLYLGEVIVGKVCGFNIGNARIYFPTNNKEMGANSYEVLVYEDLAPTDNSGNC